VGFTAPVPQPDPFLRFDIDIASPARALVVKTPLAFSVGGGGSVPRRVDVAAGACPNPCGIATGGCAHARPSWARSSTEYCHLYHVTLAHPPPSPLEMDEQVRNGNYNLYWWSNLCHAN
jgi:hypothetical protein